MWKIHYFEKLWVSFFFYSLFLFLPCGRILDPIGKYKMAFLIDQPWLTLKSWHFGGDTEIELFPRCLVDGLNFFSSVAKARADDVRPIFCWPWFRDIPTIWAWRRLLLIRITPIRYQSYIPPHLVPLVEVTICSVGGDLLVSLIINSLPIITARFVVPLTLTASQSFTETVMNFDEWSWVLFKTVLPFVVTAYKMFSTVSWPRIEIIFQCIAEKGQTYNSNESPHARKSKIIKDSGY